MYEFGHVGIAVKDVEKSAKFYNEAFGCEILNGRENERLKIIYLRAGSTVIELVQYFDDVERGRGIIDHVAFWVPNLDEAIEKVKALGSKTLLETPRDMGDLILMFVDGPNGERIELMQKK